VETCGGGDLHPCDRLLPARSLGTSRLGGVSFWGDFTATGRHEPYQPAPAFRIAAIVWSKEAGNGGMESVMGSRVPSPSASPCPHFLQDNQFIEKGGEVCVFNGTGRFQEFQRRW